MMCSQVLPLLEREPRANGLAQKTYSCWLEKEITLLKLVGFDFFFLKLLYMFLLKEEKIIHSKL